MAFGTIYISLENTYISIAESVETYKEAFIKSQTSQLDLQSISHIDLGSNVSLYTITFNISNNGLTLSPKYWDFVRDGKLKEPDGSTLIVEDKPYLLPGESILIQTTEVKDEDVHSLIVAIETGCSLKIKWKWVWLDPNQTIGQPSIIGKAWYCS